MNPLSCEGDWRVIEPRETAQFRYLCVRACVRVGPSLFVCACVSVGFCVGVCVRACVRVRSSVSALDVSVLKARVCLWCALICARAFVAVFLAFVLLFQLFFLFWMLFAINAFPCLSVSISSWVSVG